MAGAQDLPARASRRPASHIPIQRWNPSELLLDF
jgi:hypothetical protein